MKNLLDESLLNDVLMRLEGESVELINSWDINVINFDVPCDNLEDYVFSYGHIKDKLNFYNVNEKKGLTSFTELVSIAIEEEGTGNTLIYSLAARFSLKNIKDFPNLSRSEQLNLISLDDISIIESYGGYLD